MKPRIVYVAPKALLRGRRRIVYHEGPLATPPNGDQETPLCAWQLGEDSWLPILRDYAMALGTRCVICAAGGIEAWKRRRTHEALERRTTHKQRSPEIRDALRTLRERRGITAAEAEGAVS